jgi:hypothetical protein
LPLPQPGPLEPAPETSATLSLSRSPMLSSHRSSTERLAWARSTAMVHLSSRRETRAGVRQLRALRRSRLYYRLDRVGDQTSTRRWFAPTPPKQREPDSANGAGWEAHQCRAGNNCPRPSRSRAASAPATHSPMQMQKALRWSARRSRGSGWRASIFPSCVHRRISSAEYLPESLVVA